MAGLERLFHTNADADDGRTCLTAEIAQPLGGFAVGQKIVDDLDPRPGG